MFKMVNKVVLLLSVLRGTTCCDLSTPGTGNECSHHPSNSYIPALLLQVKQKKKQLKKEGKSTDIPEDNEKQVFSGFNMP